MPQTLVLQLNQAAINAIRAAGATSQIITPQGNHWSQAWFWTWLPDPFTLKTNGGTMGSLTDPNNKLVYQMHQYLDLLATGVKDSCVSSTILRDRLVSATQWLRTNGKKALLGEYNAANNPTCVAALTDGLKYMVENNDVWLGAAWWAAGPWWYNGTYYDIEPKEESAVYTQVLPALEAVVRG